MSLHIFPTTFLWVPGARPFNLSHKPFLHKTENLSAFWYQNKIINNWQMKLRVRGYFNINLVTENCWISKSPWRLSSPKENRMRWCRACKDDSWTESLLVSKCSLTHPAWRLHWDQDSLIGPDSRLMLFFSNLCPLFLVSLFQMEETSSRSYWILSDIEKVR